MMFKTLQELTAISEETHAGIKNEAGALNELGSKTLKSYEKKASSEAKKYSDRGAQQINKARDLKGMAWASDPRNYKDTPEWREAEKITDQAEQDFEGGRKRQHGAYVASRKLAGKTHVPEAHEPLRKIKEPGWYVVDHMDRAVEGPMQEGAAHTRAKELSKGKHGDIPAFDVLYYSDRDIRQMNESHDDVTFAHAKAVLADLKAGKISMAEADKRVGDRWGFVRVQAPGNYKLVSVPRDELDEDATAVKEDLTGKQEQFIQGWCDLNLRDLIRVERKRIPGCVKQFWIDTEGKPEAKGLDKDDVHDFISNTADNMGLLENLNEAMIDDVDEPGWYAVNAQTGKVVEGPASKKSDLSDEVRAAEGGTINITQITSSDLHENLTEGFMDFSVMGSDSAADLHHEALTAAAKKLRAGLRDKGNEYNTHGTLNVAMILVQRYKNELDGFSPMHDLAVDVLAKLKAEIAREDAKNKANKRVSGDYQNAMKSFAKKLAALIK